MKKGKHVQTKSIRNKRRRLAWEKIVTPIIGIFIICIIMNHTNADEQSGEEKLKAVAVSNKEMQEQRKLWDKSEIEDSEENENLKIEVQVA